MLESFGLPSDATSGPDVTFPRSPIHPSHEPELNQCALASHLHGLVRPLVCIPGLRRTNLDAYERLAS